MQGKATMAAIAALVAACITGCGGGHGSGSPGEEVAKAADNTIGERSMRAGYHFVVRAASAAIRMHGTGAFDLKAHQGEFRMTIHEDNQDVTIDLVQFGHVVYGKSPGFELPPGKHWVRLKLGAAGAGLPQPFQQDFFDPSAALAQLRHASGVTKAGSTRIGGVETTHYHGLLDLLALATSKEQRTLLRASGVRSAPFDLWVDDQNRVRRESFSYSLRPPEGPGKVSARFRLDLNGFGASVHPQRPAPGDVVAQM